MNGNTYEKLHATIDPNFLPTDLGGKRELYHNKVRPAYFINSEILICHFRIEKKKESILELWND